MRRLGGARERQDDDLSREPHPALRPFVRSIWARAERGPCVPGAREHVLPTGLMHLVIRLSPDPIAIWEGAERRSLGHAVVGGARSTYYLKDVSAPSTAVGAQLEPGAARLLFGVSADELAERHTPLDDVWGANAAGLRERLGDAPSLASRLDLFEAYLLARLPRVRLVHPAVVDALAHVAERPIAAVVERSGYSHRAFIQLFRGAVGLAPKAYARVARFQRAVDLLVRARQLSIADAALAAGYADQAHLSREFVVLAGVSPASYRALRLASPNHVPLDEARKRLRSSG